ncbi:MAG: hypothetical protein NVS1B10_06760 [Candidatus Saccharimonadales bacterium]
MVFGNCKVCEEKERRIADLKEQIAHYRLVLNPPPRINRYELEEDVLLNGGGHESVSIDAEAEAKENARIQRESDLIFSGNYTEVNG